MKPTYNFLGLSEEHSTYSTARVAVLPLPYEGTVSYGRGTAKGPQAIINASSQVELYDEDIDGEAYKIGIATLPAVGLTGLDTLQMSQRVGAQVLKILNDKKFPVCLGGEHSITPAIVEAVCSIYNDVTVIQFDAHADLRQEYEGNPLSHACALARVREICPAVQVGIRNLSVEEAAWIKKDNLPVYFAKDIHNSTDWMSRAITDIKTQNVYLTIDVDAFDSSIMPATGTPEPGGLNWYQITSFIKLLTKSKKMVGCDLVELAPIAGLHACDFLVAKLAYKCIGYALSQ